MRHPLIIEGYGIFVGIKAQQLIVREKNNASFMPSSPYPSALITIGNGILFSSDALFFCARNDMPIFICDRRGYPTAILSSPLLRTRATSQERQHLFSGSPDATRYISGVLDQKIRRQIAVLSYHIRALRLPKEFFVNALAQMRCYQKDVLRIGRNAAPLTDARQSFFLLEARAARLYWSSVREMFSASVQFPGRRHHHARDPINQLLNYGYAMLMGAVLRVLLRGGLDPTMPMLHHRQGSLYPLVYDCMEPFRPIVDHIVFSCVHRQRKKLQDTHAHLRQALLRRFRQVWHRGTARPEPWSRCRDSLSMLIDRMISSLQKKIAI